MDDLEECGDLGVFRSLFSAELHRRVRCLAMDGDPPLDLAHLLIQAISLS